MFFLRKKIQVVLALSLCSFYAPVWADITISPVQLYITGERGQSSTTAVINSMGETSERTYEIEVLKWEQDQNGEDVLTPDHTLIVNPENFVLKPDASRTVRFGFKQNIESMQLKKQESWRVRFVEIPSVLNQTGVNIALNFSLPVFVGNGFKPDMVFNLTKNNKNESILVARNNGTAHFQLTNFSIQDKSKKVVKDVNVLKYILPQRETKINLGKFNPQKIKELNINIAPISDRPSMSFDVQEM